MLSIGGPWPSNGSPLQAMQERHDEAAPRSETLFETAQGLMPGGVNSPVRAFGSVGGVPRFMARGEGAYLWDEDGNRLLDFVGSWGPLIHGHAPPFLVEAVREQLERGSSFGAPTRLEVEMAREVCAAVPSVEMVRMVNSGTEAVMGGAPSSSSRAAITGTPTRCLFPPEAAR
jgi:glutamate-1-semialdehyde aminotransferase